MKIILIWILSIILLFYFLYLIYKYKKLIKNEEQINEEIKNENNEMIEHNKILKAQIDLFLIRKDKIKEEIKEIYEKDLQKAISQATTAQEESNRAFEKYCDILDNSYKNKEKEYEKSKEELKKEFLNIQNDIMIELNKICEELDNMKKTRAALMEAKRKEQEIKEKSSFYCLKLTDLEKQDIEKLENIKPLFNQPRALSMLIWTSYIRNAATTLCNNVLGKNNITGIYKITNLKNEMCYIGQAISVRR